MNKDFVLNGNKLIAEFIGMQSTDIGWFDSEGLLTQYIYDQIRGNCHDYLYFNKSWDWLMPCIKKIRSIHNEKFNIDEYDETTSIIKYINPYDYDINFVFKNVVKFIKWYNGKK